MKLLLVWKKWALSVLLSLAAGIGSSYGQFLDLRLDVNPKITANTEQSLNFGTLMANTGRRNIDLGSYNMGVFSITALENQLLMVSLEIPYELNHVSENIADIVPIELQSRYGYSFQDYENSFPLSSSRSTIRVEESSSTGPWNSVYFFIYGSLTIGDIAGGVYTNDILLHVEYL